MGVFWWCTTYILFVTEIPKETKFIVSLSIVTFAAGVILINIMMSHRFLKFPWILVVIAVLLIFLTACSSPEEILPTAPREDLGLRGSLTDTPAMGTIAAKATSGTTVTPTSFQPQPTKIPDTATRQPSPTATLTATPTPESITRFAVIGDYGLAGKREADVAALVKSWDPDFIITTGDNNYPDGTAETIDKNIGQYFHKFIYPYIGEYGKGADVNRFFPTLGNHDWTTNGAQPYFDYFELPGNERYYDFVWGPVHLFAIDSDSREPDGVGRSSVQGQWLKDRLADSTAIWNIVYMHHPPYSSADHGSIDWAQWPYKDWGATAVISGHDHVYERLVVDGFPYFVNGLGGGPIYEFDEVIPGSEVRFRDDYGAMLVEATSQQITFQFITRQNQVIDTVTIYP